MVIRLMVRHAQFDSCMTMHRLKSLSAQCKKNVSVARRSRAPMRNACLSACALEEQPNISNSREREFTKGVLFQREYRHRKSDRNGAPKWTNSGGQPRFLGRWPFARHLAKMVQGTFSGLTVREGCFSNVKGAVRVCGDGALAPGPCLLAC